MTPRAPEAIWGDKLGYVDPAGDKDDYFNMRLKDDATDEEKADFEAYVMITQGGEGFLPDMYEEMDDPYYTWEGKVVERASLKGRGIPVAPRDTYEEV